MCSLMSLFWAMSRVPSHFTDCLQPVRAPFWLGELLDNSMGQELKHVKDLTRKKKQQDDGTLHTSTQEKG